MITVFVLIFVVLIVHHSCGRARKQSNKLLTIYRLGSVLYKHNSNNPGQHKLIHVQVVITQVYTHRLSQIITNQVLQSKRCENYGIRNI